VCLNGGQCYCNVCIGAAVHLVTCACLPRMTRIIDIVICTHCQQLLILQSVPTISNYWYCNMYPPSATIDIAVCTHRQLLILHSVPTVSNYWYCNLYPPLATIDIAICTHCQQFNTLCFTKWSSTVNGILEFYCLAKFFFFNNCVVLVDTNSVCLTEQHVLTLLVGHHQAKLVLHRT
jgi:hypothetical protein